MKSSLHIEVSAGPIVIVSLTFPGEASARLEELVPKHIQETIREQGIDLKAVQKQCVDSNFAPVMLFESKQFGRKVRVWLE